MCFYVGIDQSTSGTGVCFMAPRRMAHETIVINELKVRKMRGGERLCYIYDRIWDFLRQKTRGDFDMIKQAAMEGYAYNIVQAGKMYGNPFQLGEVGGAVKLLLEKMGVPYVVVNPMDVKRWVKGSPGGPKGVIMSYLTHEFKLVFDDDNAADAYALACIAMNYANEWHETPSNARIRDGREKVMKELAIDPHAVLGHGKKKTLREAQEV